MPNDGGLGPDSVFSGRKILLGITGGIACFKAAGLVSQLVQSRAHVRVAMTEAATRFVTPLTFQSLSGQSVVTSIWESHDQHDAHHVGHARWADMMIIAPATADVMAKLAAGLCDDVVTLCACALPRQTPVLLAPAMNEQMWQNPVTQRNLHTIQSVLGYQIVGPDEGWQACRTRGSGRMSEPAAIVDGALKILQACPPKPEA